MHKKLVNELTHFANERNIFITIETEGSHFLPTDILLICFLLVLSFPIVFLYWEYLRLQGATTDERMIKQHNKFRLKYDTIKQSMEYHSDYHIKPVWDGKDDNALNEIMECIETLKAPKDKVWFMPAGDSREALYKSYPILFDWVRDHGYRMTWRPHIIAFEDQREV